MVNAKIGKSGKNRKTRKSGNREKTEKRENRKIRIFIKRGTYNKKNI